MQVGSSGLRIRDGGVRRAKLADGAVDTDQLAAFAITAGKLGAGIGVDGQVLALDSVVTGGLSWVNNAGGGGTTYRAGMGIDISRSGQISIENGGVDTDQLAANSVTAAKLNAGSGDDGQVLALTLQGGLEWVDNNGGGGSGSSYVHPDPFELTGLTLTGDLSMAGNDIILGESSGGRGGTVRHILSTKSGNENILTWRNQEVVIENSSPTLTSITVGGGVLSVRGTDLLWNGAIIQTLAPPPPPL